MRMDNCHQCGRKPSYFSAYDTFACKVCDIWLEEPHCQSAAECDAGFESIVGVLPSCAETTKSDF